MTHSTLLRRVQGNLRALQMLMLAACSLILLPGLLLAAESKEAFSLQTVINKAQDLAKKPFQERQATVPDFLVKMRYDEWRDIRFDSEKSLWLKEKLPFTLQFFHPGLYYTKTVNIFTVDGATTEPVPFSKDLFKYGKDELKDRVPLNLGFAGFRVHFPINVEAYRDEVAVFLGASYFRAVAKKQNYGLSARGLAIDTGLPSGEEFPFFTDFWIVKPEANAKKLTLYALLDSVSVTGAYQVVITPARKPRLMSRVGSSRERRLRNRNCSPDQHVLLRRERKPEAH